MAKFASMLMADMNTSHPNDNNSPVSDIELAQAISALTHAGVISWNDRELNFFDDHDDEIALIAQHLRKIRERTPIEMLETELDEDVIPETRMEKFSWWFKRNMSTLLAFVIVSIWIGDIFFGFGLMDGGDTRTPPSEPTYGLPFHGAKK